MFLPSMCAGRHPDTYSGHGENWAAYHAVQGYGKPASDAVPLYNNDYQAVEPLAEPPWEPSIYPDQSYPNQSYPVEAPQGGLHQSFTGGIEGPHLPRSIPKRFSDKLRYLKPSNICERFSRPARAWTMAHEPPIGNNRNKRHPTWPASNTQFDTPQLGHPSARPAPDTEYDGAEIRGNNAALHLSDGTTDSSICIDTTRMVETRAYGGQAPMVPQPYDYSLENGIPNASATDEPPAYSMQPASLAQFHNPTESTECTLTQPEYRNPGIIQGSATAQSLSSPYSSMSDNSQNAFHHSTQFPTPSAASVQTPATPVPIQSSQNGVFQPPIPNINTNYCCEPETAVFDGPQTDSPEDPFLDAKYELRFEDLEALEHSLLLENNRFPLASELPDRFAQAGGIEESSLLQLEHESTTVDDTVLTGAAFDFDGPFAACPQYVHDLSDRGPYGPVTRTSVSTRSISEQRSKSRGGNQPRKLSSHPDYTRSSTPISLPTKAPGELVSERPSTETRSNKRKRNSGPLPCECGYRTDDRSNMARHKNRSKSHGAPPFKCPFCDKRRGLQRSDHLQKHVWRFHGFEMKGHDPYEFTRGSESYEFTQDQLMQER